jgi:hypothetical protein
MDFSEAERSGFISAFIEFWTLRADSRSHEELAAGLPLDALGVYLPGKLRADNFLLYFRIYGTCIWFPSLKLGGCI